MSEGPKNLGSLFKLMHNVLTKPRANGHHVKLAKPTPEINRFCTICKKVWIQEQVIHDPDLKPKPCSTCQEQLDQGAIAIYCLDGRHAFIWSDSLAGQNNIMEVSKETMDAVEERQKHGNRIKPAPEA